MTLISAVILGAWYSTIGAKFVLLLLLMRRRLAHRYVMFSIMLGVSNATSVYLAYSLLTGHAEAYRAAWIASRPLTIFLYATVSIEAFYLQAKHFPKIRWFAVTLIAAFAAISVAICALTAGIGLSVWPGVAQRIIIWMRYFDLGCLLLVLLGRSFFRVFPRMWIRQNVRRHVALLTLLLLGQVIVTGTAYAKAGAWMAGIQLFGQFWPLGCFIAWCLTIHPNGESYEGVGGAPVIPIDELNERERRTWREAVMSLRRPPL